MTQPPEHPWKMVVKGLKNKAAFDRKETIRAVIKDVAGDAAPIRTARKRLLMILVDALAGTPRFINVHGDGVVLLIALDDFLEVLSDPPPTLAEVLGRVSSTDPPSRS